jgi:hypothetical protein
MPAEFVVRLDEQPRLGLFSLWLNKDPCLALASGDT